ncbi:MAG TPA: phytanoyl-CoA dioxygenase family protein [Caldilineaceae bacterium]|nr:phytanoyl-CoA dioxygenase family protein [Caldilineaceae bacterium]
MGLTQQQKEHFWEQGYLLMENVLPTEDVEQLRRACDELSKQAQGLTGDTERFKLKAFGTGGGNLVQQVAEPHELGGVWMALVRDPRILDIVEDLLGPNIQLYYSMLMMKPPREGFTAPWHQDFAFFVHDRADILACMVAIDDATLENGCLRIAPGSHKLGLLNHFKDGRFTGVLTDPAPFDDPARQVALPAKAGSIILWHSLTLHSSHPNRSEKPRRAIVMEFKNPEAHLLGGAFNSRLEVRTVGLMVRGRHPQGDLLAAI